MCWEVFVGEALKASQTDDSNSLSAIKECATDIFEAWIFYAPSTQHRAKGQ